MYHDFILFCLIIVLKTEGREKIDFVEGNAWNESLEC